MRPMNRETHFRELRHAGRGRPLAAPAEHHHRGGRGASPSLVAAFLMFGGGGESRPAGGAARARRRAAPDGHRDRSRPRRTSRASITATGSLAARRDMPVGVAGEGGMVSAVLVEPGQWVRAGQALAVDRPLGPGAGRRPARRPDRGGARRCGPRPERTRPRPVAGRPRLRQPRPISTASAPRATPPPPASASPRPSSARRRARIGRLDVRAPDRGPGPRRATSRPARWSAPARALCSASPRAARWSCARSCRRPISPVIRVGVPATVTPVGSTAELHRHGLAGLADHRSADPPGRCAHRSCPMIATLRPGGFAAAEIRAGSTTAPLLPEIGGAERRQGQLRLCRRQRQERGRAPRRQDRHGQRPAASPIAEGLNGNERVVLSAGAFLNPGEKVRPAARRQR